MAIEKSNFKAPRFDPEFSPPSRDNMSSDEDQPSSAAESDDDDEFDDVDSDDFDLLELGETGAEFCQVENQTCSVPFELYDLPGLEAILCMDVWNDVLTEEDRFNLTSYLPDMDQETFVRTLMELFSGANLHFGSPVRSLFDMLKGGLCEPRVALYWQGLNFFQERQHYHRLRSYQNSMITNLYQLRDAWLNCRGYGIEEKLQILNITRGQKNLMYEKMEDLESGSSEREESGKCVWGKKLKDKKMGHRSPYQMGSNSDFALLGRPFTLESVQYEKQNHKGMLKFPGFKAFSTKDLASGFSSVQYRDMKSGPYSSAVALPRLAKGPRYDSGEALRIRDQMVINDDAEDSIYGMGYQIEVTDKAGVLKARKKYLPLSSERELLAYGRIRDVNPLTEVKVPTAKPHTMRSAYDYGKKWTGGSDPPDLNLKTFRASSQEKVKGRTLRNGGTGISKSKGNTRLVRSEETESDSSEQLGDDEDDEDDMDDVANNPLMRSQSTYPSGLIEGSRIPLGKSILNAKKTKFSKKVTKESARDVGRITSLSKKMGGVDGNVHIPETEKYSWKAKQKGRIRDGGSVSNSTRVLEDRFLAKFNEDGEEDEEWDGDDKKGYKLGKNGRVLGDPGERIHRSSLKPYPTDRKHKSGLGRDFSARHTSYLHDDGGEEDDSFETHISAEEKEHGRPRRKHISDHYEKPEVHFAGSNSVSKKRKGKDALDLDGRDDCSNIESDPKLQIDGLNSLKKRGKRKIEADPDMEGSQPPGTEMGATNMELETKPQKKPFILITPTVHTGFSFSVIHLLSAVRMAMIAPLLEDSLVSGHPKEEMNRNHDVNANGVPSNENINDDNIGQVNGPSFTVMEVVNRVRSNPGDPCILETQEPLQDLVRGVLKVFSSKTAPLGAKGWKALVVYERPTKSWSWVGPISHNSSEYETIEEVTSPEVWNLPHKMLVKLVDSFANWLKSGQETLQLIGSLPSPPLALMQVNMDEKERFRDHRAQRSLSTIIASSEEVRDYFRKEEVLRYSIPDRAFCYTAADGKKSIVAPLRRCGGKPTSKARDHFMLKRDRPPHVTILCLVRDAAARLPGSIGTRADVCTLIRDSTYIVEDVSDAQVNQVVSGALDRLHYERDPCVQYDAERKLWVYLHREREEEDFEDDGTSSTKKWKRPKRDTAEQSEQGPVSVEPLCVDYGKGEECGGYDDLNQSVEENGETSHVPEQGTKQENPLVWEGLNLNPVGENKLLCQENSRNEEFDDEAFGRERPVELLSTSLL